MGDLIITAVVIDDEEEGRSLLTTMLEDFFDNVKVLGTAASALEGIEVIQKNNPHVVFLDINMPHGNGFDMLKAIPDRKFEVIFTTAHQEYAIKAIKEGAKDYLVKPIDIDDLENAIDRICHTLALQQQAETPKSTYKLNRIKVPIAGGIKFIEPNDILHIEGDGNYVHLFFKDGSRLCVTKTLKEIEKMLSKPTFFRPHHSHLINCNYIDQFNKTDGGYVVMSDGTEIPISRRKKEEFMNILNLD